jgi:glycosyltransferase involved in cell wall biosynthesis
VIKEAMACNTPIVSTDVGDVKWIIGNTEGCFISSFEPEAMKDEIEKAFEFARVKEKTKGRERIIKLGLDSDTIAQKIINTYQSILDKKK